MHETQRGVPKQNATIGNADGLGFETALFLKLNSGGGAYQRTARAWLNFHDATGCGCQEACEAMPQTEFPGHRTPALVCAWRIKQL